jgi:hypothetical protein
LLLNCLLFFEAGVSDIEPSTGARIMIGTVGNVESSFTIGGPITGQRSVLTVTSMAGKIVTDHTSLFLEHIADKGPETRLIHLRATGPNINISDGRVQYFMGASLLRMETSLPLEKPEKVARVPQRSFELDPDQKTKLMAAIARFKFKNAAGRYRYAKPGGGLGRAFSLPGTRGVNCTDFAIKVLGEAGISLFGSRLIDLPGRLTR